MKHILSITLLFFCSSFSFGQQNEVINDTCISVFDKSINRTIYEHVSIMPEFPGGEDSLFAFAGKNFVYPSIEAHVEGKIITSFIIESDGQITNKKIVSGLYKDIDDNVLKLIDKMPRWNSGLCNGKKVAVRYIFPFLIKLVE